MLVLYFLFTNRNPILIYLVPNVYNRIMLPIVLKKLVARSSKNPFSSLNPIKCESRKVQIIEKPVQAACPQMLQEI